MVVIVIYISVQKALEHPFVAQFHADGDEPACDHEITIGIDDNQKLSIQVYFDVMCFYYVIISPFFFSLRNCVILRLCFDAIAFHSYLFLSIIIFIYLL